MTTLLIGLLIPLLGTMLGASFVFFMKRDMPESLQKTLLGFASGVMVAASVWSLLIPSIDMSHGEGAMQVVPAAVGFLLGMGFLLLIDELTPHLHVGSNKPAVAIIPCGDLSKAIPGEMANFWINDVSAATENLLLAAHAMGLGAVWTGLHPDMNRAKMVQEMLGLPEHIIPLCVVPVGVPAEQPEIKDKFKPENIHYNGWE